MTLLLPTTTAPLAPLVCLERVEETDNAATFILQRPDATPLAYKAGQFIVVAVDLGDEKLHRAYSLSSTPTRPEHVSITVKRVTDGRVSNHLLDHLRPGQALQAMAPAGDFNIIDRPATERIALLSAGCGITPCLSIARWLLDSSPAVSIDFIHSARSGTEVIAAAELDRLHAEHANFRLTRVLRHVERADDRAGPLDRALFATLLPNLQGHTIFCCGPHAYMDAVRSFAQAQAGADEFDMRYVHSESFAPTDAASRGPTSTLASGQDYTLNAPSFGKSAELRAGQTLLEALESAGLPIVGACRSGVCGACKCRIVEGQVDSTSTATLSDDEISDGVVLACSSTARSDLVVEL